MKNLIYILLYIPVFTFGQENSVKTTKYKVPTTDGINIVGSGLVSDDMKTVDINYLDGLGRTIQLVAYKQSSTGNDIIVPLVYNTLGQLEKEYLPYVSSGSSLNYTDNNSVIPDIESYYSNVYGSEGQNPLYQDRFEKSPFGRIIESSSPGTDWAPINPNSQEPHTIKRDYWLNNVNSLESVKIYKANAIWDPLSQTYSVSLSSSGTTFYNNDELFSTIVKNENWTEGLLNTTIEYRNSENQVVLKRNFINDPPVAADTYYVYDQYGNQSFVIPPMAAGTIDNHVLDGLCYQYVYDQRNRQVMKKLPGKQWEYTVYDSLNRQAATGPAYSPFGTGEVGWLVTKYDAFGRIAYTGWWKGNVSMAARVNYLQNMGAALWEEREATGYVDTFLAGYTNEVYPMTNLKLLTVNYYDDYAYTGAPTDFTTIEGQTVYYNNTTRKPKGLLTGIWIRAIQTATTYKGALTYMLYDKNGRIIGTQSTNYLGGYVSTNTKYDFSGKVLYTIASRKYGSSSIVTIKDEYTYTAQDRLLAHIQTIGGGMPQLLSRNEYDELGQLIVKRVGGTDTTGAAAFQKIDYSYNIRGWLTGINNTDNLTQSTDPKDLFAFKINYNAASGATGVNPLYNGNIAETLWRTASDNKLRKYGYKYDELNRLTEAVYQKPGTMFPVTNSYNEKVSYDMNGNITSLQRNGEYDDISGFQIDNLTYTYDPDNRNRLLKVDDPTLSTKGFNDGYTDKDYTYDSNGNMTADLNKNLTSIIYNHLNQPVKILFNNSEASKIEYLYDATGGKLQKKVTDGASIATTDYIDGFHYGNGVLDFFATAEGYVKNTTISGVNHYNYLFNYTDHLGNVRLTYTLDTRDKTLKIMEENNYYPFGLKHANYNISKKEYEIAGGNPVIAPCPGGLCAQEYNYKYQGQEHQDELGLNWDSFKWRNYDPAIGRFMSIDPLAEKYNTWSPYVFSGNRVIDARELEGLEPHVLFDSAEEAADNWGQQYNGKSINECQEYASTIGNMSDENGNTCYSYDVPNEGGNDSATPSEAPEGTTPEADIHSHGCYEEGYDNNIFSETDTKDNDNKGIDGYLTTPDGSLQKYDVETSTTSVINESQPSDPNDPDRQNDCD